MVEEYRIDNFIMKTYLTTLQNVVGENGLRSILNYSRLEKYIDNSPPDNHKLEIPVEELSALFRSLCELFGKKGVRGLQLRVGRENARLSIERLSAITESLRLVSRLVPEKTKMRLLLEKAVEESNQMYTSQADELPVELQENEDCFLIIHKSRFESENISSETPVCNVFVGNLQYSVEWITGHKHEVEEIECRAMGCPADIFRVAKASM
jgi:predicted hydrocarbon binding protein